MAAGEVLDFNVTRTAMVGFTAGEEWLETTIDHPVAQLTRRVVFPPDRPCRTAALHDGDRSLPLPIDHRPDGRTTVGFAIGRPIPHRSYTVRWSW